MNALLLNFAHPLTPDQVIRATELLGGEPEICDVPTQVDRMQPLADEALRLVEGAGLSAAAWQTRPIVVNPPSLAPVALALLAEIHGRCGYFPPILHIRPVPGALPPRYELAEIVNLNEMRERARMRR